MVNVSFFDGDETHGVPDHVYHTTWEGLADWLAEAATDAPGLEKSSAGYFTTCTFHPATAETFAVIDAKRTKKGFGPLPASTRAAATANGYRTKPLLDLTWVLVVDYDDQPTVPPDWSPAVWPCEVFAYSSHSYDPVTKPGKWRALLRLECPIPATQYDRVRDVVQKLLPPGALLRWAGQPAFLPTCPAGRAVALARVPGPPLDWRALVVDLPEVMAPDPADIPPPSPTQDSSRDAEVIRLLASMWDTTGHRAFGALGGVLCRMGVSLERALAIAEGINDKVDQPHAAPDVRIEEAYDGAHLMGAGKLLEAFKAGAADDVRRGVIGVAYDRVEKLLKDSVTPPPALATVTVPDGPSFLAPTAEQGALLLQDWQVRMKRTQKGEFKNNVYNTVLTLDLYPFWRNVFGYDEFFKTVVFLRDIQTEEVSAKAGQHLDDDLVTGLRAWFGAHANDVSDPELRACLQKVGKDRPVHAVRTYLEGLRGKWDGVDRNLVTYLGAEPTPYQRACCAKTLRAAVARIMIPGEKADCMLILEGEQGWKKSSVLRALCPDTRWFYEVASRDVGNKDFLQDALGKWLAEIPEVDQLIASRDESELKALLSRRMDRYRPSYGRSSLDFERQLIFTGTTNKTRYLRDETGNRRYWPVVCCANGPIRDDLVCNDRDQLWAQAVAEYDAFIAGGRDEAHHGRWWFAPDEAQLARAEAEQRLEQDPWEEMIHPWLQTMHEGGSPFTSLEALAQLPGATPGAQLTQREMNRMGKVLRKLGYVSSRRRRDGGAIHAWRPAGADY